MKHDNWNGVLSSDFTPYANAGYVVSVRLTPLCRCGEFLSEPATPPEKRAWTLYARHRRTVRLWRCPRRRWWNAWRHPDAYTLGER